MKRDDLYREIKAFLVIQMDFPAADVTEESHLVDDLEIDSLSVLELTVFTEEKYDVDIEEAFKETLSSENLQEPTVGWLTDLILATSSQAAVEDFPPLRLEGGNDRPGMTLPPPAMSRGGD